MILNCVLIDNAIYFLYIFIVLIELLLLCGFVKGVYVNYHFVKVIFVIGACLFLPLMSVLFSLYDIFTVQILNDFVSSAFFCFIFLFLLILWAFQYRLKKHFYENNLRMTPLFSFNRQTAHYSSIVIENEKQSKNSNKV
jgi:hypothetical protein